MSERQPDGTRPLIGRNAARAWLVGTQVLMAVLLIFWLFFVGISVVVVDTARSPDDPWPHVFIGIVWSWPPVAFVFSLLSWMLCSRGLNTLAVVLTTLPLVFPLAFGLVLLLRA
jgi:hypothetical protein